MAVTLRGRGILAADRRDACEARDASGGSGPQRAATVPLQRSSPRWRSAGRPADGRATTVFPLVDGPAPRASETLQPVVKRHA